MTFSRIAAIALLCFAMGTLLLSCQSFEPIQTSTPTAAIEGDSESARSSLGRTTEIRLGTGESALPAPISELTFRISRMALVTPDGSRTVRELSHANVQVTREQTDSYLLLRERIQPESYDRLTLRVQNIYVTYGPNAGAPLTIENEDITLPMPDVASGNTPVLLRISFDAAASFDRNDDGTWHFSPQFSVNAVESQNATRVQ